MSVSHLLEKTPVLMGPIQVAVSPQFFLSYLDPRCPRRLLFTDLIQTLDQNDKEESCRMHIAQTLSTRRHEPKLLPATKDEGLCGTNRPDLDSPTGPFFFFFPRLFVIESKTVDLFLHEAENMHRDD